MFESKLTGNSGIGLKTVVSVGVVTSLQIFFAKVFSGTNFGPISFGNCIPNWSL
jgi:hypothetical protein